MPQFIEKSMSSIRQESAREFAIAFAPLPISPKVLDAVREDEGVIEVQQHANGGIHHLWSDETL